MSPRQRRPSGKALGGEKSCALEFLPRLDPVYFPKPSG